MDSRILQSLSHQRLNLHSACLESETLARCCPLDIVQIPDVDSHRVYSTMGLLDILPLEIRQAILLNLDIQSLTGLRRVSQSRRLDVDLLPKYKTLRTQAPELLRAVISIGTSGRTTVFDLHGALVTQDCFLCGDFAAYIYLLSCSRVCTLCLIERVETLPMLPSHAKDKFGLDNKALSRLPTLRSLPGIYSHRETTHRKESLQSIAELRNKRGFIYMGLWKR